MRRLSFWIAAFAVLALLWFASNFVLLLFGAILAATCLRGAAIPIAGRSPLSVNQSIGVVLVLTVLLVVALTVLVLP